MTIAIDNLLAGWVGMLGGVASGAVMGLFFHREEWMQGYASFRRRMTRLGHISFFGLGFLNMMYAVTTTVVVLPPLAQRLASAGFLVGALTMPLCCFLTAWRKPFRHLFPIPVAGLLTGIVALLAGWGWR
jgi:hypothetical protein